MKLDLAMISLYKFLSRWAQRGSRKKSTLQKTNCKIHFHHYSKSSPAVYNGHRPQPHRPTPHRPLPPPHPTPTPTPIIKRIFTIFFSLPPNPSWQQVNSNTDRGKACHHFTYALQCGHLFTLASGKKNILIVNSSNLSSWAVLSVK